MMGREKNTNMWLVVHMPKTAGTSFRWALENYFGKTQVIRDYGPHENTTSEVVREHLYSGDEMKGPGTLVAEISGQSMDVLVGHFPLERYTDCFEAQNIIAFVRDPLVRMCSEYLHRLKNKSFTDSFSEFLQRPSYQNLQSRFLKGVSEETFIGVTEHYAESLQLINRAAQWNLSTRKKNVGRRGGGKKMAANLSVHESDLFYKMNVDDVELYNFITQRFANL